MAKYEAFGNLLMRLRLQAGFERQEDLAAEMGCKQQTVSRWEAGVARPRTTELVKLVDILRLDDGRALYQAWGYTPLPFATETLVPSGDQRMGADMLPAAVLTRTWRYYVTRYGDNGLVELNERGEFVIKAPPSRRVRAATHRVFEQVSNALGKETHPGWPVLTADFGIRVPSLVWASTVPEELSNVRVVAPSAPELCIDIVDTTCPHALRERRVDAYLSAGAHEVILVDVEGEVSYWAPGGRIERSSFGLDVHAL